MPYYEQYYTRTRYLLKSEIDFSQDLVVLKSMDDNAKLVFELYRGDGIRVGKLDPKRGWANKLIGKFIPVAKTEFFDKLLCD